MKKVFSKAAASLFAFSMFVSPADGQDRQEPLRPIEDYLFTPNRTEQDNCSFIVPLEFPQEEFNRRMAAGEYLDDRLSLGHHYLYLRNDYLPRVVITETEQLIDIFLSTAAIEGRQLEVSRVERPDDTITIDGSLLSEHLIQIDAKNAEISMTNLLTGDFYSVSMVDIPKQPKENYPELAVQSTTIGPFDLTVESGYIEIATPLEFEGDIPNTSLRLSFRGDHIYVQYLDEITTDGPPLYVTLPNLPVWENQPDIVCTREVQTDAFAPDALGITPRFDLD